MSLPSAEEDDFGSGMGSGSGDVPTDLEEGDDDDPSGQIKPKVDLEGTRRVNPFPGGNKKPDRPIRPSPDVTENRSHPKITPSRYDDYDDGDDDDDDSDRRDNSPLNPKQKHDRNENEGNQNRGIDFGVFIPTPEPPKPNPTTPPPRQPPTPSTRKPVSGGTEDKPSRGATRSDNTAEKTVALFKLFTPVVSSIIGKLFKFS